MTVDYEIYLSLLSGELKQICLVGYYVYVHNLEMINSAAVGHHTIVPCTLSTAGIHRIVLKESLSS